MQKRYYETTFLFSFELSDKEREAVVTDYVAALKKHQAEVVHQPKMASRQLAYPIAKQDRAVYQTVIFQASPEVISKLEVAYGRDKRVLRFLTISSSEQAVQYQRQQHEAVTGGNNTTEDETQNVE